MKTVAATATTTAATETVDSKPKRVQRTVRELRNRAVQIELWMGRHGRGIKLGMLGPWVGAPRTIED